MIVTTSKGKIQGIEKDGYNVFKGIPYAKPPICDLRWKAPEPVDKWEGVYKADQFSYRSMQEAQSFGFYKKEFFNTEQYNVDVSEDSLYLNIWTPADAAGKKLPVAFWIHGGAFLSGYGSEIEFDGEEYCKRNVILVTINYRVNIYGFLAHPWLSAENERGISGNYGILDQLAALRWVHENIEVYGGDPNNITIFGQSAGAMSVQTLVSSELSEKMIAKAIMQSGGSYGVGLHHDMPLEEAEKFGEKFVQMTGAKNLTELRKMSYEEFAKPAGQLIGEMFQAGGALMLVPNIDGYVLKDGYYKLVDDNKVKDIPYLLGSTKNDIMVTPEDLVEGRKGILYHGGMAWSHKLQELGRNPSYVYSFERDLQGDDAGAFHSAELWYMFGTLNRCWRPMDGSDYELSKEMLDYWAAFMKDGEPKTVKQQDWLPCAKENPYVKVFK